MFLHPFNGKTEAKIVTNQYIYIYLILKNPIPNNSINTEIQKLGNAIVSSLDLCLENCPKLAAFSVTLIIHFACNFNNIN